MKIGIFGDSMIAGVGQLPDGFEGVDELLKFQCNHTIVKFADPSSNIAYMQTLWAALTAEEKLSFDYLMLEVGHNDFSATASVVVNKIQALINDLYATKKPSCKIIVDQLTQMKGTIDHDVAPGNPTYAAQLLAAWYEINNCIAGTGSLTLNHVDAVITEHIPLLDDGTGMLKSIYYTAPDYAHPLRAAKDIIADCMLKKIV